MSGFLPRGGSVLIKEGRIFTMKLGVMNPILSDMTFEKALDYLAGIGVQTIEIGAGGYPGNSHLHSEELIGNPEAIKKYKNALACRGLEISAISCHGNPLHPQKAVADSFDSQFRKALEVASELGVDTVIGFSGCPGDCDNSLYPNWIVCPWPGDNLTVLNWQWNEKIIPYWTKTAEYAKSLGISRIAFEMHPSFAVYNPETLLKLRLAVGDIIGANFDPSHLFWQGIEPAAAISALRGAIYHFHAKDTAINKYNTAVNGVLDTKSYGDIAGRSWVFRTVGYGHGREEWTGIISALKLAGYDGALSIEHEDGLMTPREGLEKAVAFLKELIIFDEGGASGWF